MSYHQSLQQLSDAVLAGVEGLEPYRVNLIGGHAAALQNNFKLTQNLLGAEVFAQIAQVYATYFMAEHWDINLYGDQFSGFIAAQVNGPKGDLLDWHFFSDVAAIEYAVTAQYYADADQQGMTVSLNSPELISVSLLQQLHLVHPYTEISADCEHAEALYVVRDGISIYLNGCDADRGSQDG